MSEEFKDVKEQDAPIANTRKRASGKWIMVSVGTGLLGIIVLAITIHSNSDTTSVGDAKSVAITATKSDIEVGGKGTPAYNSAVIAHSEKAADVAANSGKSFVPPPVNSDPVPATMTKQDPVHQAVKQQTPQQQQQEQQDIATMKQAMKVSLSGITDGMTMGEQKTLNFMKPEDLEQTTHKTNLTNGYGGASDSNIRKEEGDVTAKSKTIRLPGGIHAGSILYAVNDLRLNSDGKNNVVRASIISGPLNHYTALGKFEDGGESLAIIFTRLISPQGVEYPVYAFGIDPSVPEANVASDVEHHYLSRWGGFMAATFLTGFAQATQTAGMSTSNMNQNGMNGSNYGMMTFPTYSLMQKGIIGVGQVGQQAAQHLAAGLKRPATVTLDPGITMGILIVNAEGGSN